MLDFSNKIHFLHLSRIYVKKIILVSESVVERNTRNFEVRSVFEGIHKYDSIFKSPTLGPSHLCGIFMQCSVLEWDRTFSSLS